MGWESGLVGGLSDIDCMNWVWDTRFPSRALLGDSPLVDDADGEWKREEAVSDLSGVRECWIDEEARVVEVKSGACLIEGGVAHGARSDGSPLVGSCRADARCSMSKAERDREVRSL